jgi:hypothetical protein
VAALAGVAAAFAFAIVQVRNLKKIALLLNNAQP